MLIGIFGPVAAVAAKALMKSSAAPLWLVPFSSNEDIQMPKEPVNPAPSEGISGEAEVDRRQPPEPRAVIAGEPPSWG